MSGYMLKVVDSSIKALPGLSARVPMVSLKAPAVNDGVKGDVTVSGTGAIWSVSRPRLYARDVAAGSPASQRAMIQSYLDQLDGSGGTLDLPRGPITINDATLLLLPSYTTLAGDRTGTTLTLGASCPTGHVIRNKTLVSGDALLRNSDVWVEDLTIDGAARGQRNTYLTNPLTGTAIADPIADYLPGGCLAPAVQPQLTPIFLDGHLVGATIVNPGSGLVYPPHCVVDGDGIGAALNLIISGGQVTGWTIADPGNGGYTSGSITVYGGGADPAVALYANNRRNPNYGTRWSGMGFYKCARSGVRRVTFKNVYGDCVIDGGSSGLTVEDCTFLDSGKVDFVGMAIWSANYLTDGNPGYRLSNDLLVRNCRAENLGRAFLFSNGEGAIAENCHVNGAGEAFFVQGKGITRSLRVLGGSYRGLRLTDITSSGLEASGPIFVSDAYFEDFDGVVMGNDGPGGARVVNCTVKVSPVATLKFPAASFAERVGYQQGSAARAFSNRPWSNIKAPFIYFDSDPNPAAVPSGFQLRGNRLVVAAGARADALVAFQGIAGRSNVLAGLHLEGNNLTEAPATDLYDADDGELWLNPDGNHILGNNLGAKAFTRQARATASRNLVDDASAQSLFGGNLPALRTGTYQEFELSFLIVKGANSVSLSFNLGGDATLASLFYDFESLVTQEDTNVSTGTEGFNDDTTPHTIAAATTVSRIKIRIKGHLTCAEAGSFDAFIAFSGATGATPRVEKLRFAMAQMGLSGMTGTRS